MDFGVVDYGVEGEDHFRFHLLEPVDEIGPLRNSRRNIAIRD